VTIAAEDRWGAWVERWERQQERYLVDREGRFTLMLDYAEAHLRSSAPRVLDLCCGNGALSRRVLRRFPNAYVTAVDWDPVHLEIARRTLPDAVEIVEADVTQPGWGAGIPEGGLELTVSATALHWIVEAELLRLYGDLAALTVSGGLFLNADHFPPAATALAQLGDILTERWQEANFSQGEEDHAGFHDAAAADLELGAAAALRAQRFGEHGGDDRPTLDADFHARALNDAGFAEVAEVWRHWNDAVLAALR
jgi:SAM-dependent methyltransferase